MPESASRGVSAPQGVSALGGGGVCSGGRGVCSRGVGVSAPRGWGVFAPRGCVSAPRGVFAMVGGGVCSGGVSALGGVCSGGCLLQRVSALGGVSAPRRCLLLGWCGGIPACTEADTSPVDRITYACKNITLSPTSLRPVKKENATRT